MKEGNEVIINELKKIQFNEKKAGCETGYPFVNLPRLDLDQMDCLFQRIAKNKAIASDLVSEVYFKNETLRA